MTDTRDIRDDIFASVADARVVVALTVEREGVMAGFGRVHERAAEIGLTVFSSCEDGARVAAQERVLLAAGTPKQVALAEESLVGLLAKTSGIATAAAQAVQSARGRLRVVCGAWKKMPPELKHQVREAIAAGGAGFRIVDRPFLYLDKNYVAMLGGIEAALRATERWPDLVKVIQVQGRTEAITREAEQAARGGAAVIMVDTGVVDDVGAVVDHLAEVELRTGVMVAFAGGVGLDDIPRLVGRDIDIIDIGCAVVDAPLLDMRLDVVEIARPGRAPVDRSMQGPQLDDLVLLDKTELRVEDVRLCKADLTDVALEVAHVLGLAPGEVLVVDVRDDHVTLDVLAQVVASGDVAGKERELLDRLGRLPGVLLGPDARTHSEGVLGLIALSPDEADGVLALSARMAAEVSVRVSRRAMVFSTGGEMLSGDVRDTNAPLIMRRLRAEGYQAYAGGTLRDDADVIARRLAAAADDGYGLVITTGGVGAEDKDCTVEGILQLDPSAATPWLVKYPKGIGRHRKEGVRIAVGTRGSSLFVALPGPTSEVEVALDALLPGLAAGLGAEGLAEAIAVLLRERLRGAGRRSAHIEPGLQHHMAVAPGDLPCRTE